MSNEEENKTRTYILREMPVISQAHAISSIGSNSFVERGWFADCKNTDEVDVVPGTDPRRYVSDGLNLEGHCQNSSCSAYGQSTRSIFRWGFRNGGKFTLFWDEADCKCPLCGNSMRPINCGFLRTQWRISGYRKMGVGQRPEHVSTSWKSTTGNKYVYFSENSELVEWDDRFTIEMMTSELVTYTQHDLSKKITVNNRIVAQIFISSHCHKHYQEGISERLIVKLVEKLDEGEFDPDDQEEKKEYFETFPIWEDKRYKLIW
ncbi:45123_t:CDS:2 [Gigaspora margarita]|uniref:45123_t:CDS:1 n=1 Tax=Gigaspora margarita TaxID=4874 RepID=A0ABN7UE79_GIGMA|nr:45123_t:CDS:2 [Gigaspora margarita]